MRTGNSRMKRAKTILEVAAGVYGANMLDLGVDVSVAIRSSNEEDQIFPPLKFGVGGQLMGGMKAPIEVGKQRVDISYVNPSVIATMAYRGKGFYKEPLALRALACFPSWDRIAFVVSKDLGIKSLWDIKKKKVPLVVSTRTSGIHNSTNYAITKILSLYGFSFRTIENWGGTVEECAHPSSPKRINSIRKKQVNAIFDEGLPTKWLEAALENNFEVLHIEDSVIGRMEQIGFKRALIPKKKYPGLEEDIRTLDFSGWPVITHKWLNNRLAYSVCESIYSRKSEIPIDVARFNKKSLCRDTDAGPLGIPLHPGARKFYKDKGYL